MDSTANTFACQSGYYSLAPYTYREGPRKYSARGATRAKSNKTSIEKMYSTFSFTPLISAVEGRDLPVAVAISRSLVRAALRCAFCQSETIEGK